MMSHRLMEQTRCLSHVFHDYISTHEQDLALLSALQQVNIAERINEDIDEVIFLNKKTGSLLLFGRENFMRSNGIALYFS